jgi:hypothetical protein
MVSNPETTAVLKKFDEELQYEKNLRQLLENKILDIKNRIALYPPYDNNKVYALGDIVEKDGKTYQMIDGIGTAGYPPPRDTKWKEVAPRI